MKTFLEWAEEKLLNEILKPGSKVRVPNAQGKIVTGTVVRYDDGKPNKSPFYVVDVGDARSEKVPAHKLVQEGFGKNLITAGLLGAAGLGMMGKFDKVDNNKNAAVQQDDDISDKISELGKGHNDLLQAAKRAGVPRSEWNRLRGEKRGGVVVSVNGRKVPLSKSEIKHVNAVDQMRRSMGN